MADLDCSGIGPETTIKSPLGKLPQAEKINPSKAGNAEGEKRLQGIVDFLGNSSSGVLSQTTAEGAEKKISVNYNFVSSVKEVTVSEILLKGDDLRSSVIKLDPLKGTLRSYTVNGATPPLKDGATKLDQLLLEIKESNKSCPKDLPKPALNLNNLKTR